MRLIDADALIELIKDLDSYRYGYVDAEDIQNAPTIDAVPVVHGRWTWCGEDRWNDVYTCSVCGEMAMDDSNFCPNCGAKMDLEG